MQLENGPTTLRDHQTKRWRYVPSAAGIIVATLALTPMLGAGPLPPYTGVSAVVDVFGGENSIARDVNLLEEVVGARKNPPTFSTWHGVRWRGGLAEDLGPVGSGPVSTFYGAGPGPTNTNHRSEIVGNGTGLRAVAWGAAGVGTLLQRAAVTGCAYTDAQGINEVGLIVGAVQCGSAFRPATWSSASAVPVVSSLAGSGAALAVNRTGSWVGFRNGFAVVHTPAHGEYFLPSPAGLTTGSRATSINDSGWIVGYTERAGVTSAARWTGNPYKDAAFLLLSTTPGVVASTAADINNQNFVVGGMRTTSDGTVSSDLKRPFVWHRDFGMRELPMPVGYSFCRALALNDEHDLVFNVVGFCQSAATGRNHATRWTVTPSRVSFGG